MAFNDYLNQQYNNAAAQQNIGGLLGGALSGSSYGLQAQQYYDPYHLTGTATTSATSYVDFRAVQEAAERAVSEISAPVKKAWKKTNNLLVDLRKEIDDWHGDILRAA